MTVFEIQVNPERNALIRRALAKRIVRQREVEEEEASTEEDESFLGSSITMARKGSAASVSTVGSAGNPEHLRRKIDGGGRMNAKSRWKSEYLRTRSSSPSPSGSAFMSAISEILPPEMLPEILPVVTMQTGNNSLEGGKAGDARSLTEGAPVKISSLEASDDGATTVSVILNGAPFSSGGVAVSTDSISAENMTAKPEPEDTTPAAIAIEEAGPDPVEQDLLLKLEELKKEKSRLFALFRNALQKKEDTSKSPQPHPLSQSTSQEPESLSESRQEHDVKAGEEADRSASRSASAASAATADRSSKDQAIEEGRQGSSSETRTLGRSSDQNHERRPEPLSRQNIKRREYERVIDRSKLNLEIPRKPSISSASSNSTSSTPTTSFAPPKRGRSRSPSVDGGGPFNSNNRGSSGPGSLGPSLPSTSNSSSSTHAESTSYPSKFPRADYMGLSQQQHHNRNPSSSSSNGLPDKPLGGRYHTSSHFQQHTSPSARSLGGESYHADEGGYSSRTKASSSGPGSGMNGGSNGGSYRQSGPLSYHSQGGPPPPTRIGFGDTGVNSGSSAGGRSSGGNGDSGGGGGGGGSGGRGGFYGHGHDGPPTAPISMLGPSGRTHMPFNRSMMQMPHSRGLAHGRIGFGNSSGGGGGRNAGGPPDRSMSSARPGDWSRRRSRAS